MGTLSNKYGDFFELNRYKDLHLWDAIFENPNVAFDDMAFQKTGRGAWLTAIHWNDGSKDSGNAGGYIFPESKFQIWDFARGGCELVRLYADKKGLSYAEALRKLAEIYHLPPPPFANVDSEEFRKRQTEQDNRVKAHNLFVKNLWSESEEAKKVLAYLKGRGWTEEEIKAVGLGLFSPELENVFFGELGLKSPRIQAEDKYKNLKLVGAGITHKLVIPFRNGSRFVSFVYRMAQDEPLEYKDRNGRDVGKYLFEFGVDKPLFAAAPNYKKDGELILVEGVLDALHAQAKGLENVAAYCQHSASLAMIEDAVRRGVNTFTILPDRDKAGYESIIKDGEAGSTIKAIKKVEGSLREEDAAANLYIYVGSFPEGCKDMDDYLRAHTVEELRNKVLDTAKSFALFAYEDAVNKCRERIEDAGGFFTDKEKDAFFEKINRLIMWDGTKPQQKSEIRQSFTALLNEEGNEFGSSSAEWEAWLADTDNRTERQRMNERTGETARQMSQLTQEGRFDEARELMKKHAKEMSEADAPARIRKILEKRTREDAAKSFNSAPEGIILDGYKFKSEEKDESGNAVLVPLKIPEAAITIIAAPPSHCKSTFLQNIALAIAEAREDARILYLSYEERTDKVLLQFISKYVSRQYDYEWNGNHKKTCLETLQRYAKTGITEDLNPDFIDSFKAEEDNFYNELYEEKIFIRGDDLDSIDANELMKLIREAKKELGVNVVIIDYMQLLSIRNDKRAKTEILADISRGLRETAKNEKLYIIAAAQLTRNGVKSPLDMRNEQVADSTSLEKEANQIIMLWRTGKTSNPNSKDMQDSDRQEFEKAYSIDLSKVGHIYAKITKNRDGDSGLDAVFNFNGNTGVIKQRTEAEEEADRKALAKKPNEDSNTGKNGGKGKNGNTFSKPKNKPALSVNIGNNKPSVPDDDLLIPDKPPF